MNPDCTLTEQQVETLAWSLVRMADTIIDYYRDPKHEAAFQAWYLEKYGHPAPEDA